MGAWVLGDRLKPVRVTGEDPYSLDADHDGLGCETGAEGGGLRSRYGLIIRQGKKEATRSRIGATVTAVGWSPKTATGRPYQLCSKAKCVSRSDYVLKGTAPQRFGTWRITQADESGIATHSLKLWLKVGGRARASDTVPLR